MLCVKLGARISWSSMVYLGMSIALDSFRDLPFEEQVMWVWNEGSYVATRYEEEDTVGLYHMQGVFFVELY